MGVSEILSAIDLEIAQLQKAKNLLSGAAPKGVAASSKKPAPAPVAKSSKKKRKLTPEGRKRIAEAVRRRWAAQKAAAAK
jgi:hypothetical protein